MKEQLTFSEETVFEQIEAIIQNNIAYVITETYKLKNGVKDLLNTFRHAQKPEFIMEAYKTLRNYPKWKIISQASTGR